MEFEKQHELTKGIQTILLEGNLEKKAKKDAENSPKGKEKTEKMFKFSVGSKNHYTAKIS